jgi:hypothetical protein
LSAIETRAIDILTVFQNFDDYWLPFLSAQAPAYARSLPDDHRSALREQIRNNLPIASDGTVHLKARAWAIRGAR